MTIDILRQVTLFSTLEDHDLQALAALARPITVQRGEIIISQGSVGDALYVVISGRVRVYVSDKDGKEMVLTLEGPSAVFGEIAVLDGAVRSASIAAMEKTELLKIGADDFFALNKKVKKSKSEFEVISNKFKELRSLAIEYKNDKDREIQKLNQDLENLKSLVEESKSSYENLLDKTTQSIEDFLESSKNLQ